MQKVESPRSQPRSLSGGIPTPPPRPRPPPTPPKHPKPSKLLIPSPPATARTSNASPNRHNRSLLHPTAPPLPSPSPSPSPNSKAKYAMNGNAHNGNKPKTNHHHNGSKQTSNSASIVPTNGINGKAQNGHSPRHNGSSNHSSKPLNGGGGPNRGVESGETKMEIPDDEEEQKVDMTMMQEAQSPLKAASDLIRSLDHAYAEMNSYAITTKRNAEDARRNARAASEIARRYSSNKNGNRKYSHLPSPANASVGASSIISIGGVSLTSPLRSPAYSEAQLSTKSRGSYANWDEGSKTGAIVATTIEDSKVAITPIGGDHSVSGFSPRGATPMSTTNANSNGRRRRQFKPPSSTERLAQSHADEVLALSLELERSKQSLQTEQQLHDDSKAALAAARNKNKLLEEQLLKLKQQQESQRDNRSEAMEQEMARAQYRVQAAEEDAQLALDLAKQNSQARQQMELRLADALKEVERLRQLNEAKSTNSGRSTPVKQVRFADQQAAEEKKAEHDPQPQPQQEQQIVETPTRSRAPRSMIAAGRHLLRRAKQADKPDVCTTVDFTPTKSVERRRRLRERLQHLAASEDSPKPGTPTTALIASSPAARNLMYSDEVRSAAKLLQDSGKRLQLAGHWWRSKSAIQDNRLEAMTRQYCQSVEFKMDQHKKEIDELGALCGYLERRIVVPPEPQQQQLVVAEPQQQQEEKTKEE